MIIYGTDRDAEEGFNACAFCGFENFKRIPFCNLCGEQIVILPPTTKDGHDGAVLSSPAVGSTPQADAETAAVATAGAATTQRQKRARYSARV